MSSQLSLLVIALVFVAVQCQAPAYNRPVYKILRYDNDVQDKGYRFHFDTDEPVTREEQGQWQGTGQVGPDGEEIGINRVNGYASWNLDNGTPFQLTYEADDQGYRPHFVIGNGAPIAPQRSIPVAPRPLAPQFRPFVPDNRPQFTFIPDNRPRF